MKPHRITQREFYSRGGTLNKNLYRKNSTRFAWTYWSMT